VHAHDPAHFERILRDRILERAGLPEPADFHPGPAAGS
jgi:hypothetical protein